jgi:hypothetical protein
MGYVLSLGTNPKILTINNRIDNSLLRPISVYQQSAQRILKSTPLNRSKITIDTGRFSQAMKQQFPELSEVSVTLPIVGHRPLVELAAARPRLILVSQNGELYLVDSSGRALMKTSDAKGVNELQLPKVIDQSGLSIATGQGALTGNDVAFITTVVLQLQAKHLRIDSIILPPIPSELHVELKGSTYYIKFNLLTDARVQSGTFLAVKDKLASDHIAPKEYIDVRVAGRVFYK